MTLTNGKEIETLISRLKSYEFFVLKGKGSVRGNVVVTRIMLGGNDVNDLTAVNIQKSRQRWWCDDRELTFIMMMKELDPSPRVWNHKWSSWTSRVVSCLTVRGRISKTESSRPHTWLFHDELYKVHDDYDDSWWRDHFTNPRTNDLVQTYRTWDGSMNGRHTSARLMRWKSTEGKE